MSNSNQSKIKLHHIAIAVNDANKVAKSLNKIIGLQFESSIEVKKQKVKTIFSNCDGASVEIVEATDDKSPIYPILDHPINSFIKKYGEGIHHVCFEIEDLNDVLKKLESEKIDIIGGDVLEGSHNSKVIFLKPSDKTGGMLIELREKIRDDK